MISQRIETSNQWMIYFNGKTPNVVILFFLLKYRKSNWFMYINCCSFSMSTVVNTSYYFIVSNVCALNNGASTSSLRNVCYNMIAVLILPYPEIDNNSMVLLLPDVIFIHSASFVSWIQSNKLESPIDLNMCL